MVAKVRVFVDFWNFQLGWNQNVRPDASAQKAFVPISWEKLAPTLLAELPTVLGTQPGSPINFRGVNVYASVNPQPGSKDEGLKNFLARNLSQMSGYTVHCVDRKERRSTDASGAQTSRFVEKGVDTKIVTDLFAGAINDSYDVALLISNDADFVPAIQTIQERLDRQIIHVGFRRGGDEIRASCWGHVILDGDVSERLSG